MYPQVESSLTSSKSLVEEQLAEDFVTVIVNLWEAELKNLPIQNSE